MGQSESQSASEAAGGAGDRDIHIGLHIFRLAASC
jgi:hypothetical protein